MEVLITMARHSQPAFNIIKEQYDIDTLREIRDHGCQSGVANNHIYYTQTRDFFDIHEDEMIEYLADTLGGEVNEELWNNNPCNITGYKNDIVWTYIELVANTLVEEYESITCEEMNDSFDDVISFCDDTLNQLVTTS